MNIYQMLGTIAQANWLLYAMHVQALNAQATWNGLPPNILPGFATHKVAILRGWKGRYLCRVVPTSMWSNNIWKAHIPSM